jgi:hypothetical protein
MAKSDSRNFEGVTANTTARVLKVLVITLKFLHYPILGRNSGVVEVKCEWIESSSHPSTFLEPLFLCWSDVLVLDASLWC